MSDYIAINLDENICYICLEECNKKTDCICNSFLHPKCKKDMENSWKKNKCGYCTREKISFLKYLNKKILNYPTLGLIIIVLSTYFLVCSFGILWIFVSKGKINIDICLNNIGEFFIAGIGFSFLLCIIVAHCLKDRERITTISI